ncbi:G-protein alpha subunit [Plasmodiophora brassicae]
MCGGSSAVDADQEEVRQDAAITTDLRAVHMRESKIHKLLLLGSGESGKSTLFKQMRILHGAGYSKVDLEFFKPVLQSMIVSDIQQLIRAVSLKVVADAIQPPLIFTDEEAAEMASISAWRSFETAGVFANFDLTPDRGAVIARMWKLPQIRAVFEHRRHFHLSDNAQFFFDKVEDIATPSWAPSVEDIVLSRVRSVGIVEEEFEMGDGATFRLVDVGGQRSERRKWIHSFSEVSAVLFVAAIDRSEYDQKCWEDNVTPRITESLTLFSSICGATALARASVIVFLNKSDLFRDKLRKYPLQAHLPSYVGDGSYESASLFMKNLYLEAGQKAFDEIGTRRTMYFHFTTATDKNNVKTVFNDVKSIVLKAALQKVQLM